MNTRQETKIGMRKGESHVRAVREHFEAALIGVEWQAEDQLTLSVKKEYLPKVVEYLYYERYGWLSVVVGNDERPLNGFYAVMYVLSMEGEDPCYLVVRALVDPVELSFPSVTPLVPACVWGERELRDMYGLRPEGLPDERRLVLPDDWPEELYPLRKDAMDYRHRPAPTKDEEDYVFIKNDQGKETTVVPVGPLHITSDEPGHFRLFTEGERIIDADYRMFYVHRGMEKVAESRLDYNQVTFLTDRICGICGYAHSTAYAETVEKALGMKVPDRAQYIRSILLETERLHSHLLNLGLVCHFCGFDTGFNHFFRTREKSMELAEILTGSRKTYGLNLIGGVRRDILAEQKASIFSILAELKEEVKRLEEELMSTANVEGRTKGIGFLHPKVARDFSPVGPLVRGSGFARDVRANHPFAAYKDLKLEAQVQEGCDVLSRTLVRFAEFYQSIDIIEDLLYKAPGGPILDENFEYQPHRFALGVTEAPRGEDMHWSMLGDNQKLYRWRCKAATYSNWPVLRYMLRGNMVSDAPLIVGSIDPCYSCTDRVTVIDVNTKKRADTNFAELEQYCLDRRHSPLKW